MVDRDKNSKLIDGDEGKKENEENGSNKDNKREGNIDIQTNKIEKDEVDRMTRHQSIILRKFAEEKNNLR